MFISLEYTGVKQKIIIIKDSRFVWEKLINDDCYYGNLAYVLLCYEEKKLSVVRNATEFCVNQRYSLTWLNAIRASYVFDSELMKLDKYFDCLIKNIAIKRQR